MALPQNAARLLRLRTNEARALVIGPQKGDDLFGVNDSDELFVVIDDGEGAEVVFVEELGYFAAVGVDAAGDEVALRQAGQRRHGLLRAGFGRWG